MPDKNEIVKVLYEAAEKSFTALFGEHGDEHFYYCTLVMADAATPCMSAQSEESLKKYLDDHGINASDDIFDYKWSWADSLYCAYGYEEYFGEVDKLFQETLGKLMNSDCDDDVLEEEYQNWLNSMETVMKMLDEKGIFGSGKQREEIFVYAEESPPDDEDESYYERAKRMNPPAVYEKWLSETGA